MGGLFSAGARSRRGNTRTRGGRGGAGRIVKLGCIFTAALVLIPIFVAFALIAVFTTAAVSSQNQGCGAATSTGGGGSTGGSISAKQTGYVQTIIGEAKTMGLPQQAWVIGIMVVLDESSIQMYANVNVPASMSYPHDAVGSDHASVGLFQQQVGYDGSNAFGWGTLAQIMDPSSGVAWEAYSFYRHLQAIPWQSMTPWMAAQSVQRSGTPDGSNYEAFLNQATAIVNANSNASPVPMPSGAASPSPGGGCTGTGNATTQAIAAAADALDKLNWMYCQPAAGYSQPSGFVNYPGDGLCRAPGGLDCAGAVAYVLQHAGMTNFITANSTSYESLPWQKVGSGMMPYIAPPSAGVYLYTSAAHTFLVINGRTFSSDTEHSVTGGPHWRTWDAGAEESGDGPIMWMAFLVPGTA